MSDNSNNTNVIGAADHFGAATNIDGPANTGNSETNPPPPNPAGDAFTDGVTLEGNGTPIDLIRIKQVQTDTSLQGDGTVASPLLVPGLVFGAGSPIGVRNDPIGTIYRDTLTGILWGKSAGTNLDWCKEIRFNADGSWSIGFSIGADVSGNVFVNGSFLATSLLLGGYISRQGIDQSIAPLPAGDTNNYTPGFGNDATINGIAIGTNALGSALTGLALGEPFGHASRIFSIMNLGPGILVLKNANPGSLIQHRMSLPGGTNLNLDVNGSVTFYGSGNTSNWVVLN